MAEKTIDKLRKLIEHEKSARTIGNQAEAEAFAAKIQELLLKHKLEMSDVEYAATEAQEPVLNEFIPFEDLTGIASRYRTQGWVSVLAMAVAEANFCSCVKSSVQAGFFFVGRETDRETAKTMFRYLYQTCIEVAPWHAQEYAKSEQFSYDSARTLQSAASLKRTFNSGFKLGFASAIYHRLKRERETLLTGVQEQGLIRLDQLQKQVDDVTNKTFPHLRKGRKISTRSHAGYHAGKQYGANVGLNGSKRLMA